MKTEKAQTSEWIELERVSVEQLAELIGGGARVQYFGPPCYTWFDVSVDSDGRIYVPDENGNYQYNFYPIFEMSNRWRSKQPDITRDDATSDLATQLEDKL